MSTIIDGNSIRAVTQGILVEKTAAVAASGAATDLFSVTGTVLVVGFLGVVETALPADTDLDVDFDPDDGGSDVALASTLVADSDPTGSTYALNATAGGALVVGTDVAYNAALATPIVLIDGDVKLASSGGGAGGGSIHWYLIYAPISAGASVEAA